MEGERERTRQGDNGLSSYMERTFEDGTSLQIILPTQ